MAFSFQNLKYGWVALASITLGVTIYVANNIRQQVKPEDIIEIALGTHERCLATQYQTNPVAYRVDPPSFVRDWITTNESGSYITQKVTNAIGWFSDRPMMIELDAKIKDLVPYYCDTNTVYDGTTNIIMLTVTGLWASLGIGDKTNQFTSVPCWTNPVQTNWHVCYTSYWPTNISTFPTTNNYTSTYNQVVNYGESWTATGGVVWAKMSNWPNEVVQTTNIATYGDYPWRIYKLDLEERYKVLNALKQTARSGSWDTTLTNFMRHGKQSASTLTEVRDKALADYNADIFTHSDFYPRANQYLIHDDVHNYTIRIERSFARVKAVMSTDVCHSIYFYAYGQKIDPGGGFPGDSSTRTNIFKTYGDVIGTNAFLLNDFIENTSTNLYIHIVGDSSLAIPSPWVDDQEVGKGRQEGYWGTKSYVVIDWQFNYATNKYWN